MAEPGDNPKCDSDNMIFHNFAIDVRTQYNAFIEQGFSKDESFQLIMEWVKRINLEQVYVDPEGNIGIDSRCS